MEALPDSYYEELGETQPRHIFDIIDDFRFFMVYRYLLPGSVLDVGAYFGDFLKIARNDGREIYGTEINNKRVDLANNILGDNVVRLDFRNGSLNTFVDGSVDNVACSEVIEHVPDDTKAVAELCRVSRKRVVITVPYQEKISQVLCIHCIKYTSQSGHLHSYTKETFHDLIPGKWRIVVQRPFWKKTLIHIVRELRIPRSKVFLPILYALDALIPGKNAWMVVVLDRES